MQMGKNHFETFQLPVQFDVNQEEISLRYRELQSEVHPDKFSNSPDQQRLESIQQASQINEAFTILKSPLERAKYLLKLQGIDVEDHSVQLDTEFLSKMLDLRETIENISTQEDPYGELTTIQDQLESQNRDLIEALRACFEQDNDDAMNHARTLVLKLQFLQKLLSETESLEDNLIHEL